MLFVAFAVFLVAFPLPFSCICILSITHSSSVDLCPTTIHIPVSFVGFLSLAST